MKFYLSHFFRVIGLGHFYFSFCTIWNTINFNCQFSVFGDIIFRPCHELSHKVSRRITLITNRRHHFRVISIFKQSRSIVIRNFQVIQKYIKQISPAYASLGGSLVNDVPVTEVIIIENSLLLSNQEAMVPINDVRFEGSCLSLADNLL